MDGTSERRPEKLIEHYHQLAESMNERGAMELSVPFYRQTIVLFLAERRTLLQQFEVERDRPNRAHDQAEVDHHPASPAAGRPSLDTEGSSLAADVGEELAQDLDNTSAATVLQALDALEPGNLELQLNSAAADLADGQSHGAIALMKGFA